MASPMWVIIHHKYKTSRILFILMLQHLLLVEVVILAFTSLQVPVFQSRRYWLNHPICPNPNYSDINSLAFFTRNLEVGKKGNKVKAPVRYSSILLDAKKNQQDEDGDSHNTPRSKSTNNTNSQSQQEKLHKKNNHKFTSKNNNNAPKTKKSNNTEKNNNANNVKNDINVQIQKSKSKSKRNNTTKSPNNKKNDWLNLIDPYQAGKKLRQNLDSLSTLPGLVVPQTRSKQSIFYLDDRIFDTPSDKNTNPSSPIMNRMDKEELLSQSSSNIKSLFENPIYENYDLNEEDYAPEVLVVGATGEVGRKIVQRLVRDPQQRFRVRVLVRNLYSKTLNLLGSGVTYCQGDLQDLESLEYAVTDVDKIVFCAGAPRMDEVNWREKFEDFVEENLEDGDDGDKGDDGVRDNLKNQLDSSAPRSNSGNSNGSIDAMYNSIPETAGGNPIDWKNVQAMMDIRSRLAEQVDFVGMQNLLQAYQNVRFADYGTSQAAKRSLFKFQSRPEDFSLFSIDDDGEDDNSDDSEDSDEMMDSIYNSNEDFQESNEKKQAKRRGVMKSQYTWMKNKFGHGVFTGRVPVPTTMYSNSDSPSSIPNNRAIGTEAAVVSGRLRSRDDPDLGVDLGNAFAGLLCRICADGGTYEAFIRTADYANYGIEYICEFETGKKRKSGNKSSNKFMSLRLPFSNFKPVKRMIIKNENQSAMKEKEFSFNGCDVRQIGFRFRSEKNVLTKPNAIPSKHKGNLISFYLALSYIKVYRAQVEPEFIYVSDARIPPVVKSDMVRHEARYIETEESGASTDIVRILDEQKVRNGMKNSRLNRSDQETYFKYLGEQLLRNSGLSYSIVRVPGYNESPSGESSTIKLQQTGSDMSAVSRTDVAEVCASCLQDTNACNLSFYVSKAGKANPSLSINNINEDIADKVARLTQDT